MRRKKLSLTKKITLCALVALLLCTIPTILSLTQTNDLVRGAIVTVSSPLTKLFSSAGKTTATALASKSDYESLLDQLADAKQEIGALKEQLAALEQLKKENEQLRDYLGLKEDQTQLTLCQAAIIYNNDPTGRTVTLNRGSRDGITVGMPVLSASGLYGTVSEVSLGTCKVTTLKDENVFVGATVKRSGINGTLCGLQSGQTYAKLQYLDTNVDYQTALSVGDIVTTNGFGFFYNQTLNNYYEHEGLDFSAEVGASVIAVEDGVVESVFVSDVLSGTEIIVDHGNGLKTLYRFVTQVDGLKAGDSVTKGQTIATVSEPSGSEYKDGAHLHFEVIENGANIDPVTYLSLEEK